MLKKINRFTAVEYLKVFFPTVRKEIVALSEQNNFPGVVQVAVDDIKVLTENSNVQKINISIKRMYWIYKNGNSYIRYIIENLFVRSFGALRKNLKPQQWKFIYQEIPKDFRNVYSDQTKKDQNLKL
ncbi:DUF7674 family protein [Chryseobacterium turcicum]|uniref:DUF7674 domain-containing protein n=1 Tax=Chryseobacterium turcicum TaxID=2898076 RepID=A0A9Q3YVG6_9FLAO|nr:hypothetical protein [Chryseobacterium turcicum]MCD1117401.1 hypothetical protein [Chryseobacterium turcicum]